MRKQALRERQTSLKSGIHFTFVRARTFVEGGMEMTGWRLFADDTPDDNDRWLEEFRKWKARRQARRDELAHAGMAQLGCDGYLSATGHD